ncbi:hypothetical protein IKQ26_01075 [bacterium]|nr:hypothetical protein [bacterium]
MNILKAPTTYNEGLWNNQLFYLNGSQHNYDNSYVRFYLNDGTSITSRISTSNSTHKYIALQIDINGDKKPNKLGKDIFRYYYIVLHDVQSIQGKFIPDGFITDRNTLLSNSNDAKCNKNQSGNQCAAVIMMDGWQIKDDYPW